MTSPGPPGVDELSRSPAWLPLESLGADRVALVRLAEADYRAASFLDQRLLAAGPVRSECAAAVLAAAAAPLKPCAHYLFHTGHVGSTLIARLLGEHAALFVLREPALLRELATGSGAVSLATLLGMLGRTWRATQHAVVKATSFASELAAPILALPARPCAVFVVAQPAAYLGTICAGPNSRAETRRLAGARLARLARRLGCETEALAARAEGEWIAMSWLCELAALVAAGAHCGERILWVDFDAFLAAPAAGLVRIFRGLGVDIEPRAAETLAAGPLMQRYSKAPEHPYDAGLRYALLAEAQAVHADEIRRGLAWLERTAAQYALAAAALAQVAKLQSRA